MLQFLPSHRGSLLIALLCFCLMGLALPALTLLSAYAEGAVAPTVTYIANANTIVVGSSSGTAASQPMTISELATVLAGQGHANLLVDQGSGNWLLKASIIVDTTAKLEITNAALTWLRLESPPIYAIKLMAQRGGYLLLDGVKVTSWDSNTNAEDLNIANGRAYLLALDGGRMDILHSEVAYLGWESGEASGIAWRKRIDEAVPSTGSTGRLEDSHIHHNYFGMYSFEAYGLTILRNKVYENIEYGIDPHDDSRNFEVAYNEVYQNGNHGIIFSRLCRDNIIHHNDVHDNALHGIMLDRGSNFNTIRDNVVYNNQDGVALFESSDNVIQNNHIHHNVTGMRLNATFVSGDPYDGVTTNNQVIGNQIEDSSEQGIYLYARADRNIITGNTIVRSGVNGIYIKSGGNKLENNTIDSGVNGVTIYGGEYLDFPPQALPALDPPGNHNVVISNTISANSSVGIRILGGSSNRIGPNQAGEVANQITNSGSDGIAIGDAANGSVSTDNVVIKNNIVANLRHGILIKDASSVRNRISQNSITNNGQRGIKIDGGAQQGIQPPVMTGVLADGHLQGTAAANATVELYSDPGTSNQKVLERVTTLIADYPIQAAGQPEAVAIVYAASDLEGKTYLGTVSANGSGEWSFLLPTGQDFKLVTALVTDSNGNSSAFSSSVSSSGPFFALAPDDNGQTTIQVTGSAIEVTLATIQAGLGAGSASLLQNLGNGIWLLNANLFIGPGVTLNLSPAAGVNELRLRSQVSTGGARVGAAAGAIDYNTFVYLRTHSGEMDLNGVKVYSWDPQTNAVDQDIDNGRAYVIAKYDAVLNITSSELSYLGSADGESYGVAWRDLNHTSAPNVLRSRVTGQVVNSQFHHNYYGVYTFQASDMLFRGNQFHDNIRYGFDPHDFTHDVLVENNLSFNNGSHGFIISKGCNNFVFRYNKSYNNGDPNSGSLAHGFMLDPGSPNADTPQSPSLNNLLENNEAYNNVGYGLRILGSNANQILHNRFHHNQGEGIVIDLASTGNLIEGNSLTQNGADGVDMRESANNNNITGNTISENNGHGIYVRSDHNLVSSNMITQNQRAGIFVMPTSGLPAVQDNQLLSNTVTVNGENGIDLRKAVDILIEGNLVEANSAHGLYFTDGANQNAVVKNSFHSNGGYGIRANGLQTLHNSWSENSIYGNLGGGIANTSGANLELPAPQLLSAVGSTVNGKTAPGFVVEIFSDNGQQGQVFEGRTIADGGGNFTLTIIGAWHAANIMALVTDAQGNSSDFSASIAAPIVATPTATAAATSTATVTPIPSTTPTPTGAIIPIASATTTATATPTPTGTLPTVTSTPTFVVTDIPGATATPTVTSVPVGGTSGLNLYLPFIAK
ncbi:MAG: right-handed parallel beta-helix repeat-containing protein [Caldilineaceae bacterium]